MAAASHGVTKDQLIWIKDAYIRKETYDATLAILIHAHHRLPIASVWGDGTTSSSYGQTLNAPKVDSVNDFDHPDTVTPKPISGKLKHGVVMLTLPPASVTVVSLQP